MIGPFGKFHADPAAPACLDDMAARTAPGLHVDILGGKGAALGLLSHGAGGAGTLADPSGELAVVVAGHIYNGRALCPALEHDAPEPAQVVAALYRADRLDDLAQANGQFCAALVDRTRHRLVLVTDRLATFPIHVWQDGAGVAFASGLYVLLGDARVGRRARLDTLAQLFTMQRTIGTDTPIAGVEALPAATIATFDREGRRDRHYWQLRWNARRMAAAECAEALQGAMRAAVARAQGAGADGLLLSGGLDSRWLLAARQGPMHCWTTASYADNPELAIARQIAKMAASPHHACLVDPASTLRCLEDAIRDNSGLYPASTPFAAFMPDVGRQSRAIISGHGVDYTLRGYYLPAQFLRFGGTATRLPALRPIPQRPTGRDVLNNLRQGPPLSTLRRIVAPSWRERWWDGLATTLHATLEPWLA
ncbi:MAG: asparagine synthase-related protein, partial [Alphaproteobacteria bacterium]